MSILLKMERAGSHQHVSEHLKVGPKHVEALVRHILSEPKHQLLVEKYFPTKKYIRNELPRAKPQDLLYHPPF